MHTNEKKYEKKNYEGRIINSIAVNMVKAFFNMSLYHFLLNQSRRFCLQAQIQVWIKFTQWISAKSYNWF